MHNPMGSFGKYTPLGGLQKGAHVNPRGRIFTWFDFTFLGGIVQFYAIIWTTKCFKSDLAIVDHPQKQQKFAFFYYFRIRLELMVLYQSVTFIEAQENFSKKGFVCYVFISLLTIKKSKFLFGRIICGMVLSHVEEFFLRRCITPWGEVSDDGGEETLTPNRTHFKNILSVILWCYSLFF
jgi:hypothetical protein